MLPVPTHEPPAHPGEVLREDFLKPFGMTQKVLSERTGLSYRYINGLAREKRSIDAEKAVLLGRFFGVSPQFWLNLQQITDLYHAQQRCEDKLRSIQPCQTAADGAP